MTQKPVDTAELIDLAVHLDSWMPFWKGLTKEPGRLVRAVTAELAALRERVAAAEAEVKRIKQVLTERELRAEVEWLKEREKTIKAESAERERIAKELTSFGIEFFSCASYAEMLRKGIAMVPVSVPSGAIQTKTYPAGPAMETFTMDQDAEDEENIELQQMRRNWQAAVERADMAAADYWEEHDRCGRLSQERCKT